MSCIDFCNNVHANPLQTLVFSILGTSFEFPSVLLIQHLTSIEGLVSALILDALFVVLVLFNPKFAWATPNKVPNWVQKRVRALSEDERQAIQTFDEMEKLF